MPTRQGLVGSRTRSDRRSDDVCIGRYKAKFHLNERTSQWCCTDPEIPHSDWQRIENAAKFGRFGPPQDLTRGSVILIVRDLKMTKYRERWRKILTTLNQAYEWDESEVPTQPFLDYLSEMFRRALPLFERHKNTMPVVSIRKDGSMVHKHRHNFPSFNHFIRKTLESWGDYSHHEEFPLPRSHTKLMALDDVIAKIADELPGFTFVRSAVIKRPKIKKTR
jgi:hypothetical protein